jgi:nucleoside-diphosphate-sugar epimerase
LAVALTGASGFVGSHLLRALREAGAEVRVLPSKALSARTDQSRDAVRRAMLGADAVVHLAGRAHVRDESPAAALLAFRRSNVDMTRDVVAAARETGVRQLVYFSSAGAVATSADAVVDETTRPAPDTPYGQSKLEAERMIESEFTGEGSGAVILRPPMIYGPGMKGNPLSLMRLVDRGIPLPFARLTNRRSMSYVGNVVDAVLELLARPVSGVETFFLKDGDDLTPPELVSVMARALGRPSRLWPCPPAWLATAGTLAERARHPFRSVTGPPRVVRLVQPLVLDASRLTRTTGFSPRHTSAEGWARTAEWFRLGRTGVVPTALSASFPVG